MGIIGTRGLFVFSEREGLPHPDSLILHSVVGGYIGEQQKPEKEKQTNRQ